MNFSDEAILAAGSALVTGVVLRLLGWWAEKNQQDTENEEIRRTNFQTSIQDELEDVRDENKKYKDESDHYRELYFETLERLHAGGSVKEVQETLEKIYEQTRTTRDLLAQHLRDGVYLLEQGRNHDQAVIDAFASLGVDLPGVDYQTDKALGAKKLLDQLEHGHVEEEKE